MPLASSSIHPLRTNITLTHVSDYTQHCHYHILYNASTLARSHAIYTTHTIPYYLQDKHYHILSTRAYMHDTHYHMISTRYTLLHAICTTHTITYYLYKTVSVLQRTSTSSKHAWMMRVLLVDFGGRPQRMSTISKSSPKSCDHALIAGSAC